MSRTQDTQDTRWTLAECHLIAMSAHEHWIQVEPWQVHLYLDVWRQWYYGMMPDSAIMQLPGVCRIPVLER